MSILDMTGKPCPLPVIEAKKALRAALPGDVVAVKVDNDISRQNLEKMARDLDHAVAHEETGDGCLVVSITVADHRRTTDGGGLVIAIGHDVMGGPGGELGKWLLRSFIHSLPQLKTPPERVIFYNGGVRLAADGSESLDDLRALAAKGTRISGCAVSLEHYRLTDALAVGDSVDMFEIASAMSGADKLIQF